MPDVFQTGIPTSAPRPEFLRCQNREVDFLFKLTLELSMGFANTATRSAPVTSTSMPLAASCRLVATNGADMPRLCHQFLFEEIPAVRGVLHRARSCRRRRLLRERCGLVSSSKARRQGCQCLRKCYTGRATAARWFRHRGGEEWVERSDDPRVPRSPGG